MVALGAIYLSSSVISEGVNITNQMTQAFGKSWNRRNYVAHTLALKFQNFICVNCYFFANVQKTVRRIRLLKCSSHKVIEKLFKEEFKAHLDTHLCLHFPYCYAFPNRHKLFENALQSENAFINGLCMYGFKRNIFNLIQWYNLTVWFNTSWWLDNTLLITTHEAQ